MPLQKQLLDFAISSPLQNRFNVYPFIVLQLLAALLYCSFFYTPTYELWSIIDNAVFYEFNGWLKNSRAVQIFWAILSVRAFDIVVALFMLTPFIIPNFVFTRDERLSMFIVFIGLSIIYVAVKTIFYETIVLKRSGPSLVLNPSYLLNDLVPEIPSKDRSKSTSFPGDHAAVLLCWSVFLLVFSKKNIKWLSLVFAVFFCLPRLVAGAHWLTDIAVGSVATLLVTFAWGLYTPLGLYGYKSVSIVALWCVKKYNRLKTRVVGEHKNSAPDKIDH